MADRNSLTSDRARELLDYDAATGVVTWRGSSSMRRSKPRGTVAGCIDKEGYRVIQIMWHRYYMHRVVWLIVNGEWPVDLVDHINGIRDDNRIINLRNVSQPANAQNQRAPHSTNKTSGLLGVHLVKRDGRWRASITVNRKKKNLGSFDDKLEAHEVYLAAKRRLHPGCSI